MKKKKAFVKIEKEIVSSKKNEENHNSTGVTLSSLDISLGKDDVEKRLGKIIS